MKTAIFALFFLSQACLADGRITIDGDEAADLTVALRKNGTAEVKGYLTVKNLVCKMKAKAGSPQPYTDCEYDQVGADGTIEWHQNDMGSKSAYLTMMALLDGGIEESPLTAKDVANRYISKVKAKKVQCTENGSHCQISFNSQN